jgi:hypothetical protein
MLAQQIADLPLEKVEAVAKRVQTLLFGSFSAESCRSIATEIQLLLGTMPKS